MDKHKYLSWSLGSKVVSQLAQGRKAMLTRQVLYRMKARVVKSVNIFDFLTQLEMLWLADYKIQPTLVCPSSERKLAEETSFCFAFSSPENVGVNSDTIPVLLPFTPFSNKFKSTRRHLRCACHRGVFFFLG